MTKLDSGKHFVHNLLTIKHYGVKGMKWGVRRYQDHDGKRIGNGGTEGKRSFGLKDIRNRWSNLSDRQKKIIKRVLIGIAVTAVVAGAAYYASRNKVGGATVRNIINKTLSKSFNDARRIPSLDKLPELPRDANGDITESIGEAVRKVNPDYLRGYLVDKNNCFSCSMAYELRRRGYDVRSVREIGNVPGTELVNYFKFDTDKFPGIYNPNPDAVIKHLKNLPDNARGAMTVLWEKTGTGHIFNFEMVNGVPEIIDAQTGSGSVLDYFQHANFVQFYRLDNLDIADGILKRVLKA